MKIHTLENARPDGHFPVSHTCFFSLEWPRYSCAEVAPLPLTRSPTLSPTPNPIPNLDPNPNPCPLALPLTS